MQNYGNTEMLLWAWEISDRLIAPCWENKQPAVRLVSQPPGTGWVTAEARAMG